MRLQLARQPVASRIRMFPHPKGKEFVDLDEDLQIRDLGQRLPGRLRQQRAAEALLDRGHGPEPGQTFEPERACASSRVCVANRWKHTGATTARPMFHPVPLAHLAGRGFHPHRQTALHEEHEKLGAVWMPAGDWQRPEYLRAGR